MTLTAAAAGGDQFQNDGKTLLRIKNADGSGMTATVTAQTACNYGTVHSTTVTVGATTGDVLAGPFDPAIYNNSSGYVVVTYSAVTSVTVGVASL
jgi:hypothetical protein